MSHRIKLLIGLSFLGIACSTTTTPGGDDDDDDDAGVTVTHPGDDSGTSPSDDASIAADAATPAAAATTADAAPKQPPVSCPVSFSNTTCESCFATSCVAQCDACAADSACNEALICIAACTSETCDAACIDDLPQSSLTLLDATLGNDGCLETTCKSACAAAPTAKTGDPCTTGSQCVSGVCNGSWCEPAAGCVNNTDCGIDSEGELVWCVETSGGTSGCFPGCSTNTDCDLYPGTTCKSAVANNGYTTYICSI